MADSLDLLSKQDIFKLEQDVMEKLNYFNQTYAAYLRCGSTGNSNQQYIKDCPSVKPSAEDVDNAYNAVTAAATKLNNAMDLKSTSANNSTGGAKNATYETNYNAIMKQYTDLVKKRKDIDNELAELYNTAESTSSFYDKMYMTTMYSKILLTILATSIIYYTIMKLRNK